MHNNASLAFAAGAPRAEAGGACRRGGRRQRRLLCRRLPGAGGSPRDAPGAAGTGRRHRPPWPMHLRTSTAADRAFAAVGNQADHRSSRRVRAGRRHPGHGQERGDGGDGRSHSPPCCRPAPSSSACRTASATSIGSGRGSGHERVVVGGMVPFNVVQTREADGRPRFHRRDERHAADRRGNRRPARTARRARRPVAEHADMPAVQWGKLLLNLNNALNALSGLPLATQLADRRWRLLLAAADRGGARRASARSASVRHASRGYRRG